MKKVEIGKMRSVVKFEYNEPVQDEQLGGQIDNYLELLTTRGELIRKNGNRILENGQVIIVSYSILRCRIQSALAARINMALRLIIDNRIYTIDGYSREDQKNFIYVFNVTESEQGN